MEYISHRLCELYLKGLINKIQNKQFYKTTNLSRISAKYMFSDEKKKKEKEITYN